ncbi:MAG: hypothetical protein EOP07_12005 [Proteobacteria bacterium]|nr:MAG: hypothetical protein EOP07_12005 [Pseudomonadota bacterium]
MIGSFLRGIQGNEWSHFMDYLSPVFFEVVPALDIARQTTQLGKTYAKLKHPEEEAIVRSLINDMRLPVNFRMDKASSEMLTSLSKQGKGRILLSLYFGQLMHNPLAWIDLRSSTFEWLSKECNWKPGAWIVRWDETFLNAMRKVYRGYYLADDALYLEGLAELQLEHSADLFRKQFGDGSQKAVQFKMKDFRDSFHQIFLSCKRNKTSLHPNFFAFGLFLSSLYEHLESLGESFNVREIFVEVLKARSE